MMRVFVFCLALFISVFIPSFGSNAAGHSWNSAQVDNAPPYEERLLRLSEIIGSVHFLTLLCTPDEGKIWLEQMDKMLNAEAPDTFRRARLVERFNSGFMSFQATYRKCTPSAQTALSRYIGEAQFIIKNLTSDFTG